MPTITFTAGAGGSGKSTVLRQKYPTLKGVDPDAIKESLPGYDPKHPELIHDKSSVMAMRAFYANLAGGGDFYFDGTGRNIEKYITLIGAAKAAGFKTKILFVRASLETCLARNAARSRKVPAEVILEAHQAVEIAQTVLSKYVDEYEVIQND